MLFTAACVEPAGKPATASTTFKELLLSFGATLIAPTLTDKSDKLADAEAAEKAATARTIDFKTVFILIFLGRLSS